jgi:phosphopantothenoylcysteine decarboxylase/phosphopantothenate--cysteine ligase
VRPVGEASAPESGEAGAVGRTAEGYQARPALGCGSASPPAPAGPYHHAMGTAIRPSRRDLAGRRVVVTAGGTREPIDPVRFIGNRSSGKMGLALALADAARARGARVTLITTVAPPRPAAYAVVRAVETVAELRAAVLAAYERICPDYCAKAGVPYPAETVAALHRVLDEFDVLR